MRGRIQSFQHASLEMNNVKRLSQEQNKELFGSKFVQIAKRNRRIFKGKRILMNTSNFLTGNAKKSKDRRRIDIFILSKNHLNILNRDLVKNPKNKLSYGKPVLGSKKMNQNSNATNIRDCNCKKVTNNIHNKNMKYLIMANIIKTKNIFETTPIFGMSKRHSVAQQHQLVYLAYILPWKRATQIVNNLEDEEIDVEKMCENY